MTTSEPTSPRTATRRPKAGTIGAAGVGTTLASLSRIVSPHSAWATILLLAAPSVSAAAAVYGPVLSDYVKTEFQAMLDNVAEKRARERPIKAAKKQIKARLKNRSLSAEKKTDLLKTLEALDDIGLAKMLQDAGIAIAAVSVESPEPTP